ncbi:hypothetical protein SCARD494_08904 [Seiridium cardinale]
MDGDWRHIMSITVKWQMASDVVWISSLLYSDGFSTESLGPPPPGKRRATLGSLATDQPTARSATQLEVTGGHLVVQVASQGKRRGDSCLHPIRNCVRHPVDDGKLRECMKHLCVVWWAPLALSVGAGASVVSPSAQAWDWECHWECHWECYWDWAGAPF